MLQTDLRLQIPNTRAVDSRQPSPGELIDNVFGMLRRNLSIIFFTTLIGIVIGVGYALYAPPLYSANAQLLVDTRKLQVFEKQPVLMDAPNDPVSVENQIQILQSKAIALSVVRNLQLATDPTFIEQSEGVLGWLLGGLTNRSSFTASLSDAERSEEAVEAIQQNLKV